MQCLCWVAISYDDLNVSPTALAEPTTRGLLTNSLQSIPDLILGNTAVSRNGSLYTQQLAEGPYPAASLYSERTFSFATGILARFITCRR